MRPGQMASGRFVRRAILALVAMIVAAGVVASAVSGQSLATNRSPLVGQWQRVTTCSQLVTDLKVAGLGKTVAQAWVGQTSSTGQSSFKPGSPKPTRTHPCRGAIARLHSHFFTASGQFGSLDWLGGQVDSGPYRIINSDTVEIGSAKFHFTISDGGTRLMLTPLLTSAMIRQADAHPNGFTSAFWAVTVAYAGHTWARVPCSRCG
jgi:hypothetical protein